MTGYGTHMLLLLFACTEKLCDEVPTGEASIVAVGDSILGAFIAVALQNAQ